MSLFLKEGLRKCFFLLLSSFRSLESVDRMKLLPGDGLSTEFCSRSLVCTA